MTNTLLHEDYSDNEANLSHFRTEAYNRQTWRRIKEPSNLCGLDELIQRSIEEANLQLQSGLKQAVARVSDSPLYKKIL